MQYSVIPLTSDEIVQNSVLQITDEIDLSSPKLGAISKQEICETCGQTFPQCLGHIGHIKCQFPFYHPVFYDTIKELSKHICLNCLDYSYDTTTCDKCKAAMETLELTFSEDVLLYIACSKKNYSNILKKIYKKATSKTSISKMIQLYPFVVNDIFKHIIGQTKDYSPKLLSCMVQDVIPVVSNCFRVSQPDLDIYSATNQVYTRMLKFDLSGIKVVEEHFIDLTDAQALELTRYYQCIYLLLSHKQPSAMKDKLNIQGSGTISLFAASLGKSGFFRGTLNACRVNKACRTVVTGDPYLLCRQCGCPQMIAEQIGVPIRVNSENIDYIRTLIQNFPKYPCVLTVGQRQITDKNKDTATNTLQIGDIIQRQVVENDICLANRYPSLREESIGCYNVVITNQSSVQFNMSVIKKMNADFDGDEMQLFFFASADDRMQAVLLSSMYSQFIEYQHGNNIIGGAPDLGVGIYQLQRLGEFPKLPKEITYKDDNIDIQKGVIKHIDKSIADKNSKFLQYVWNTYGQTVAVGIIDTVMRACYDINQQTFESYQYNILNVDTKAQDKIEDTRIKDCNKLLKARVDGSFEFPLGIDKQQYFTQYLQAQESFQGDIQLQILINQYTSKKFSDFYNKDISKNALPLKSALVSVGQTPKLITDDLRTVACYPKFNLDITSYGYIKDCYMNGLSQTSQFFQEFEGRENAYDRGNATAVSGYLSRRINKGMDAIYVGANGMVFGDNNRVIAYQFGIGCDPRHYTINDGYQIPFVPIETEINENDLKDILRCRITEQMTPNMHEIIYSQAWNFYDWCKTHLKTTKKVTHIAEQYKKCTIAYGEPIGPKAALSLTEPKTQGLLNVIHAKHSADGNVQYITIQQQSEFKRFLELTQAQNLYTIVKFKLLDGDKTKFIQYYQTHNFQKLEPIYNVYIKKSNIYIDIKLDMKHLANYNIDFQNLIDGLKVYYEPTSIEASAKAAADVEITMKFSLNVDIYQLFYKVHNDFTFGSGYLSNMYDDGDFIIANLDPKFIDKLYDNISIDPTSISTNNVLLEEELFGIEAARQKLFAEYNDNSVQINFFELVACAQTALGHYTGFSRNFYLKQPSRDFVSNIIYEQGASFVQQICQKQRWYDTTSFQNASMFDSKAAAGSDASQIFL